MRAEDTAAGPSERVLRAWRQVGILVVCFTTLAGGGMAWADLAQQQTHAAHTYLNAIKKVEITTDSASVTVRAGAHDRTVVSQSVGWAVQRPQVRESVTNDTLQIAVDCPAMRIVVGCDVRLDVEVPETTAVHASNESGRTDIRGISGRTEVETGSGQVGLTALTGSLWVKTDSGQVIGSGLACKDTQVGAVSGEILLTFDRPPATVTARLGSGQLSLALPDDGSKYHANLNTISGDQRLDETLLDASSPRTIDVSTASGPILIHRSGPDSATEADPRDPDPFPGPTLGAGLPTSDSERRS